MLSKPIELAALEVKRSEKMKEQRKPKPFKRMDKKLPDELHERASQALKKLLAEQKAQNDNIHAISAAGPFGEIYAQLGVEKAEAITLDPSAQVSQLYSHLVDKLVYSHENGINETTFFLDDDAFASSILKGAKITLTEYSTAPKIFNIQFAADPAALAYFQPHAAEMQRTLNNSRFDFTINRIDAMLLSEDERYATAPVTRDREEDNE